MSGRYSIMVKERFADREIELCQVDNNPKALVKALKAKRTKRNCPKFTSVRVVDNHLAAAAAAMRKF